MGAKQAVVSVSEFSQATLDRLIERAVFMAKLAPDDPWLALADKDRLFHGSDLESRLELFDPTEISVETLKDRALACEAAGVALDSRLQSDGAMVGCNISTWTLLTSHGFHGHHQTSSFYQAARLVGTDASGAMERDYEGRSARFYEDLPPPETTGRIAAQRTLSALGAQKLVTQTAPVVFDARIAKSLLGHLIGAISGPSITRGSSFLKTHLGKALFASSISIIDDPLRKRGLGSALFDDEGVATEQKSIIDNGVLATWLLNTASARQLGLSSTGHASRSLAGAPSVSTHNLYLAAGSDDQAGLLAKAGKGVLVTGMFGASLNPDTGDWSAGAQGFWFENGAVAYPVNEITVAGNLIELFGRLEAGSDLEFKGSTDSPSVLIDAVSIGGQ